MLHGRWVRPRGQGPWLTDGFAKPLKIDDSSIKHLPGVSIVRVYFRDDIDPTTHVSIIHDDKAAMARRIRSTVSAQP